jgi:hypothetical protein
MASQGDVRLIGLTEGVQALRVLRDACGRFHGPVLRVGSDLIYAWGIETGRTKGGRVARKRGPANYLSGAITTVAPKLRKHIVQALDDGGSDALDHAMDDAGKDLVTEARARVPVVTGRLKRSIRSVPK